MVRLLIIAFVLALAGCAKPNPPITDNPNENFIIRMHENGQGELELRFRTERDYGCKNYIIKNTVNRSGSDVSIHLLEIVKPELCLTALGPATVTINLGKLANGTYELKIQNGRMLNLFSLKVTDDIYVVVPKGNARNVWFDELELRR